MSFHECGYVVIVYMVVQLSMRYDHVGSRSDKQKKRDKLALKTHSVEKQMSLSSLLYVNK